MHMRSRLVFSCLILSAVFATLHGQSQAPPKSPPSTTPKPSAPAGMTNQDVIDLVKNGFGDDLVLNQIQAAKNKTFDLTTKGLIALKSAGVSERIITVMLGSPDPGKVPPATAAPVAPTTTKAPSPVVEATPMVPEIGVYYKRDTKWADLLPEVINWKTGGLLKKIATAGIVKGDVNGVIQNPGSKTVLKSPVEILVYTADGVAVTEYQLLRLRINDNSREFRTVTGGVLHTSSGAMRDMVPFESTKVAVRTYLLALPNLTPGEYGILAPGSVASSNASAQMGKIYTFRLE